MLDMSMLCYLRKPQMVLAHFSCVPKHMHHFVTEYTESDDGAVKNLKYRQFQFLDSNKVVLQYSVRFCSAEMSGECNKTVSSLSQTVEFSPIEYPYRIFRICRICRILYLIILKMKFTKNCILQILYIL